MMFDFERSAAGQFLLNARAFAAELEFEKLRERIQRGKLPAMPKAPFGYRWRDADKAALAVDPDTVPIVKDLFARVAAGTSLHRLADELNANGVPTPTGRGHGHHATVRKILARETYTSVGIAMRTRSTKVNGKRQRHVPPVEERIVLPEGTIPPLVPGDTFAAVQARLTVNKTEAARRNSNPEDFLLRGGFIYCGYCGKVIAARSAYTDHTRPSMGSDCPLVWIDAATIDAAVWQRVNSILTKPETIAAEAAKRRGADPTVEERAAVGRVLTAVRRQQTNLARARQH
jgi:site-specific DNA recombinase